MGTHRTEETWHHNLEIGFKCSINNQSSTVVDNSVQIWLIIKNSWSLSISFKDQALTSFQRKLTPRQIMPEIRAFIYPFERSPKKVIHCNLQRLQHLIGNQNIWLELAGSTWSSPQPVSHQQKNSHAQLVGNKSKINICHWLILYSSTANERWSLTAPILVFNQNTANNGNAKPYNQAIFMWSPWCEAWLVTALW